MAKVYVCPQCSSKLFNPKHLEEKECKVCKTSVRPVLEERAAPTPIKYEGYPQEHYAPAKESFEAASQRRLLFRAAVVLMGIGVVILGIIFHEAYVVRNPDLQVFNSCIIAGLFFGYGAFLFWHTRKKRVRAPK